MLDKQKVKDIYTEIQKKLFYMIPEKWDRVYLYAAMEEKINHIQTGEMFFYYYPKGLLKKNPVNVYEIPSKFNIEEDIYMKLVEELYEEIQILRKEYRLAGERLWSNITIKLENCKFSIEYHYDDLEHSSYSSYDRHIIWRYKYLKIEPISKKDKKIINNYLFDTYHKEEEKDIYIEGIYQKPVKNIIEYGKEELEEINQDPYQEKTKETLVLTQEIERQRKEENTIMENKNQILNSGRR